MRRSSPANSRKVALLLLAAVLASVNWPSVASARTEFQIYGAQGDKGDKDECPAGSYMVGFVGGVGNWIDQIGVVCGKLQSNGSVTGANAISSRGGSGGTLLQKFCGPDEVIDEIHPVRNDNYQIAFIQMNCRNLRTSARTSISFGGARPGRTGDTQKCKAGELATGLHIRYGKHVNGLGLICGDYRPVAAQAPPPPSPNAQLCRDYGARQAAKDDEYARLNCRGWAGAKSTAAQHERQCLGYGDKAAANTKMNESTLEAVLVACRKTAPSSAAIKTVDAKVTVYDRPVTGREVCYLDVGNTVRVLSGDSIPPAFRNPPDGNWVAIMGATGPCSGKVGGIYNDGKLK